MEESPLRSAKQTVFLFILLSYVCVHFGTGMQGRILLQINERVLASKELPGGTCLLAVGRERKNICSAYCYVKEEIKGAGFTPD